MLSTLILISGWILITTAVEVRPSKTVDYCDPQLCRAGKKHIACNNDESFSPECGQDVHLLSMEDRLKMLILGLHNKFRNNIAEGKVANYSTARRMSVLSWDHELEYLAKLNARQCKMEHDECRNTKKYSFVGQNLGIRQTWPKFDKYPDSIKKIVTAWFEEFRNANQTFIDSYHHHPEGKKLGHFTAMIGDRTVKMGCACILFCKKEEKKNCFLMVCNYSSTNIRNEPVYKTGEPGSGCETGKSPRYPGLCKYTEKTLISRKTGLL